jgi:hypothetical protein
VQTGKGGSIAPGVREHLRLNAVTKRNTPNILLRDMRIDIPIANQLQASRPVSRTESLDAYEFVVRPDVQFYVIAENARQHHARIYGRSPSCRRKIPGGPMGVSVGHSGRRHAGGVTARPEGDRDNDSILIGTGLILSDEAKITTRMRKIDDQTRRPRWQIDDPKA